MAVTNTPIFTQAGRAVTVQMTTANTNRDGTGTLSAAIAPGANGSLVDAIIFEATVTTTAGTLRIFYAPDGVTFRLFAEVATAGVTPSGTVAAERKVWIPDGGQPFPFIAGSAFKFCPNNAETWNVTLLGGDF